MSKDKEDSHISASDSKEEKSQHRILRFTADNVCITIAKDDLLGAAKIPNEVTYNLDHNYYKLKVKMCRIYKVTSGKIIRNVCPT